jgi:hypothetical protein
MDSIWQKASLAVARGPDLNLARWLLVKAKTIKYFAKALEVGALISIVGTVTLALVAHNQLGNTISEDSTMFITTGSLDILMGTLFWVTHKWERSINYGVANAQETLALAKGDSPDPKSQKPLATMLGSSLNYCESILRKINFIRKTP